MIIEELATDVNCVVSWRARPASFVSLMSVYESNYIRLAWLVPRLDEIEGTLISSVAGDCNLHLAIEERARYTTTLTLSYVFDEAEGPVRDPDLTVRVYHDARLAEVQACARWHRHETLASIRSQVTRELGERWLRNIMLNKWLDYCVERGHRFEMNPPAAV
jgi:uncharacterized protein YqiB (DUF1249 family)